MKKKNWVGLIFLVLFGLSIPWYLSGSAPVRIWFGLPHWVVLSLLAIVATAIFTVLAIDLIWPEKDNGSGMGE